MSSIRAISSCPFHQTFVQPIQHAYDALVNKIKEVIRRCFGYLLRILLFQIGERDKPGAQCVMDAFNLLTSDPKRDPIDPARLQQSLGYFQALWGNEVAVEIIPRDMKAKLNCLHLKKEAFWDTVKAHGGESHVIQIRQKREIIQGPKKRLQQFGYPLETVVLRGRQQKVAILDEGHKIQGELLKKVKAAGCSKGELSIPLEREVITGSQDLLDLLDKFFLPIREEMVQGVKQRVAVLPPRPELSFGRNPIVVVFPSPGRTIEMERRIAGLHSSGVDLFLAEARGHLCEGTPSEGGYYLDGKAIVNYLLDEGYAPNDIILLGYCGGAARAAAAAVEHHAKGVHFVLENPFHSLEAALNKLPWPLNKFAIMSMNAIKATDPETSRLVEEDLFNTAKKFEKLEYSETGGIIAIMDSEKDPMMPKDSAKILLQAASKTRRCIHLHRRYKGYGNPHMQRPTEDPAMWNRYRQQVISAGNNRVV